MNNIIEVLDYINVFPGIKNARKCKILLDDNSIEETIISNEEVELSLYLKDLEKINRPLNLEEFKELKKLIDNFSNFMYKLGEKDVFM